MLSIRKRKILKEILVKDGFVTGTYLGSVLSVTSRTVRSEVKELNFELEKFGTTIKSRPGKGYFVETCEKARIKEELALEGEYKIPILPQRRIEYIIKELIVNPMGVSLSDLSKEIFVSVATLKRDFDKVNHELSKSKLSLMKVEKKYYIQGDEVDIRKLYFSFITSRGIDSFDFKGIKQLYDETKIVVRETLELAKIDFSGNEFITTSLFMTIERYRISNGYIVTDYTKHNQRNDQLVDYYVEIMGRRLNIKENELEYLRDFLYDLFSAYIAYDDIKKKVKLILDSVCELYNHKYGDDLLHRLSKVLNKKTHVKLLEYQLHNIAKEYPFAFEMAITFIEEAKKNDIYVDEDSIKHIILNFVNDVEETKYHQEMKKINVVVVSVSGKLSQKLIRTKLKRHFSNFNVMKYVGIHELEKLKDIEYQLLISTTNINVKEKVVVVIDPLFKDYDAIKINNALNRIEEPQKRKYELANLFSEELFLKDLNLENPFEVIKELNMLMSKKGLVPDSFLEKVYARENISLTAIGNMVAIPHALNKDTKDSVAAVAILKNPINWFGEKVQIVFLLNISSFREETVRNIFDSFYDLTSSNRKIDRLIKADNYYEFVKSISK